MIRQAVELSSPLAEAAQQEIIVQLPTQPIYLEADPVRLSQVISNLINNACKFSGAGNRIYLSLDHTDQDLIIKVKDEGIGIPPDMLDAIFEMFLQIDQSVERTQGGLGIGLTLAKRLVELHGGNIAAYSQGLGKGSEFVVRLPATLEQLPEPVAQQPFGQSAGKNRILIVDDNIDSAKSLAEVLSLVGNETHVVHDGGEAVDAAENLRPEIILLDIGLPTLNGFDACRRIRANPWGKNILILALTGWGQQEDRRKSAEAGFDGHLVKPVDLSQLMGFLSPARNETS